MKTGAGEPSNSACKVAALLQSCIRGPFVSAPWTTRKGPTPVLPAFASAQDPPPDSFNELETKYIFDFTFGSDIGAEGERELELTTKVNFQKRTGSYAALDRKQNSNIIQPTVFRSSWVRQASTMRLAASRESVTSRAPISPACRRPSDTF